MPPLLRKLGPGQKPKLYRPPKWRSMAPDLDPSNLGEDQLFLSINARSDGGQPVLRGGQRVICNLGAKITGLGTHKIGPFKSLFSGGVVYDEEFSTWPFRSVAPGVTGHRVMGIFGSNLFMPDTTAAMTIATFSGVTEDYTQNIPLQPIVRMPSGFDDITAIYENEGVLLIALKGSAGGGVGTSAIFSYDGTTVTKEIDAIDPCYSITGFNDSAVAFFTVTGQIRIRAGGVWGALISPSAGTMVNAQDVPFKAASYRGILWMPAGNNDLFGLDETGVLTQYPRATTGIDVGGIMRACTVLNGVLYFLWDDNAVGNVWVGSYNGTTWTPKVKTLIAATPAAYGVWMVAYRGRLVAQLINSFTYYYFSPTLGAISGTWTSTNSMSDVPGSLVISGNYAVIF